MLAWSLQRSGGFERSSNAEIAPVLKPLTGANTGAIRVCALSQRANTARVGRIGIPSPKLALPLNTQFSIGSPYAGTSFHRLPNDIQCSVLTSLEHEIAQAVKARDEGYAHGRLSEEEKRQLETAVTSTEALLDSFRGVSET